MTTPDIERRRSAVTHDDLKAINDRLDRGSERMKLIEESLERNTEITQQVRDFLSIASSGLKVLGWIGVAGKWLGGIAAAGVAIWSFFYTATHSGNLPGK